MERRSEDEGLERVVLGAGDSGGVVIGEGVLSSEGGKHGLACCR